MFIAYLVVLRVVINPLIVRTNSGHRNSEIYQAMQIGVLHLTYTEEPIHILARKVKELRNKQIPLVKVLWKQHNTKEATWESEETMRQQFPQLFASGKF